MEDLVVNDELTIPGAELEWRFEPSGGPGGQHANRSSTRAVLSFDVGASSALPAEAKATLLARLGPKAAGTVVTVSDASSRSQWSNRQRARRKLSGLLADAMRVSPVRRPSRPSAAARRRRLDDKRRRGEIKRLRRPPRDRY